MSDFDVFTDDDVANAEDRMRQANAARSADHQPTETPPPLTAEGCAYECPYSRQAHEDFVDHEFVPALPASSSALGEALPFLSDGTPDSNVVPMTVGQLRAALAITGPATEEGLREALLDIADWTKPLDNVDARRPRGNIGRIHRRARAALESDQ